VVLANGKILERDLERHFSKECKRLCLHSLKIIPRFSVGWPDRLVILDDTRVLWVELKTPTGVLSEKQKAVHKMLASYGHNVLVLRTKEEITYALAATYISNKRG
jgi:hypothetical protein